jgi:hypothetical protein
MNTIRALYEKASTEEKSCKQLMQLLSPYDEHNNPLLSGYRASGIMMMANYVMNPFSKFSYFKKGKRMLEKAVAADGNNVELRFLRFAVQTNIPFFLGYKDDIQKDKSFLLNALPELKDMPLKEMMNACFEKSDYLTNTEKAQIK